MKTIAAVFIGFCVVMFFATETQAGDENERYWPQWRGPLSTGVAPHANPPLKWDENTNIKWKIHIPGIGHATPVIWGDRIFVSTAVDQNEADEGGIMSWFRGENTKAFVVMAINRADGKVLWQHVAREEAPHEGKHETGSWASNSPVTDGEHVYAYFGSRGLYCYDLDGNPVWERDFGDMQKRRGFGEGSSPYLYKDRIIIIWDHEGQSFITALDKRTGKDIWRENRDEMTSWASPLVVEHNGKSQIVTSATYAIRSHDLDTGKVVWTSTGMTTNPIPTPVASSDMVYITSGYRGNALQAIRISRAEGDVTRSGAIAWQYNQDTPYAPSPLLYEDRLYFLKSNDGILSCLNAATGEVVFSRQRLDGIRGVYASPLGAANRVYIASLDGVTLVIRHGDGFEVLAKNVLDDSFAASPVAVDNELYLRGNKALYCIVED